jgi:hypothetical protein
MASTLTSPMAAYFVKTRRSELGSTPGGATRASDGTRTWKYQGLYFFTSLWRMEKVDPGTAAGLDGTQTKTVVVLWEYFTVRNHAGRSDCQGAQSRGQRRLPACLGWLGECAREDWCKTKAEYNRRYRERHPERIQAFRPIYKQREKAKRLGLEQFPLPTWDKEQQSLEIPFV